MISAFPNKWIAEANSEIERSKEVDNPAGVTDIHKKRCCSSVSVSQIRKSTFCEKGVLTILSTWLDASIESDALQKFAILSLEGSPPNCIGLETADFDGDDPRIPTFYSTIRIDADEDPGTIIKTFGVFTEAGAHYKLIDAYLDPIVRPSTLKFVQAFMQSGVRQKRSDFGPDRRIKFDIYTSDKANRDKHDLESAKSVAETWFRKLDCFSRQFELSVSFWDFDEMHERVIMSNWLGIRADEGFDRKEKQERSR